MKAIDYIRKGWTQKVIARKKDGQPVPEDHSEACSWCAVGAIRMAYLNYFQREEAAGRLRQAARLPDFYYITNWNDSPFRTKEEVLAVFEKADI